MEGQPGHQHHQGLSCTAVKFCSCQMRSRTSAVTSRCKWTFISIIKKSVLGGSGECSRMLSTKSQDLVPGCAMFYPQQLAGSIELNYSSFQGKVKSLCTCWCQIPMNHLTVFFSSLFLWLRNIWGLGRIRQTEFTLK